MTHSPLRSQVINTGAMTARKTWLFRAVWFNSHQYRMVEMEGHDFHAKHVDGFILNNARRVSQLRSPDFHEPFTEATGIKAMHEYRRRPKSDRRSLMVKALSADILHPLKKQPAPFDVLNPYAQLPWWALDIVNAAAAQTRRLITLRGPLHRVRSRLTTDLTFGRLAQFSNPTPDQVEHHLRQPHLWRNAPYDTALRRLKSCLGPTEVKIMLRPEYQTMARSLRPKIEPGISIPTANAAQWVRSDKVTTSDPWPTDARLFRRSVPRRRGADQARDARGRRDPARYLGVT